MADDISPHIGGTPLGTVQERNGTGYASKSQASTQRRTEFAGIGGGDIGDWPWFGQFQFGSARCTHFI